MWKEIKPQGLYVKSPYVKKCVKHNILRKCLYTTCEMDLFFFIQIFFAVLSEQLHGLTVSQGKVVHDKNIGRQGHLDFPLHFTDEFLCSKSQMISTAFRKLHVSESLKKE